MGGCGGGAVLILKYYPGIFIDYWNKKLEYDSGGRAVMDGVRAWPACSSPTNRSYV